MIWDGISDTYLVVLIDKLRRRFSTVEIYFLLGSPITAIATVCFFNSHRVPEDFVLVYSTFVLLVFRAAYPVVDVPHNSLLSFITKDDIEGTNIVAMRIFCSSMGRFLRRIHFTFGSVPIRNGNMPTCS
jgi:Na+/melibiose symporter-like transporter